MSISNQIGIVRAVRSNYGTPLGDRHAAFLMTLALSIGQAAGLLRKTGGTTITLPDGTTVAQDIICFPDGEAYDVLGDGEGAAVPQWGLAGGSPLDPARYYKVPGTVPPVVPPTGNDPIPGIQSAIKTLTEIAARQDEQTRAVVDTLASVLVRLTDLEQRPPVVLPQLRVKGSTGRNLGHSHSIDLQVEQSS